MSYHLILGDRAHSSWSMRAWLLFDVFGLKCRTHMLDFSTRTTAAQLADAAPARTVPALRMPEGTLVWDSLAIAEELATRHPDAGLWPEDPAARGTARSLVAEMHAGFLTLREHCPMNLRAAYRDVPVSPDLAEDLARLEVIWSHARATCGGDGPWLCGGYSIADAFFAPVAARIAGYGLPVGPEAMAYVGAHLAHPSFRRWRAMGLVRGAALPWYDRDFAAASWPGPEPLTAQAVEGGPSVNATCPYSGDPVKDFLMFRDQVWGFCNAFCRDKTVADPEAWPAFMEMVEG